MEWSAMENPFMNRWSFELRQARVRDNPPGAGWIIQKKRPIAMKKAVPYCGGRLCADRARRVAGLIHLGAGLLDGAAPLVDFAGDERARRLGRQRHGFRTPITQEFLHFRRGQRMADLLAEPMASKPG
ncbi:hypothetical protein G6F66_014171 [Rhizopus arrhizus]|nr:hypothetical protein G6F66_014171 [Rhizopus arrhizus]